MKSALTLVVLSIVGLASSHAAVQTFTDVRQSLDGLPVTVTATLNDPYPDVKPIQRYGDFTYWYTAGPDWRTSTATLTNGFTASMTFTMDTLDPNVLALSVQSGFNIDRGQGGTQYRTGEVAMSLRIMDDSSYVVASQSFNYVLQPDVGGYGAIVQVPDSVGQHFTVEANFHIIRQGQYLPVGATKPVNERYLFEGFAVSTTPVPEPGAVGLALAGSLMAGVMGSATRRKRFAQPAAL